MATVRVFTAARMAAIEALAIVGGAISGDNLILSRNNGQTIDAGNVRGPQGIPGVRPAGIYSVTADLPNISGVVGSAIGDYFINGSSVNRTILGVNALPGDVIRATSATVGVVSGNLKGPTSGIIRVLNKVTGVTTHTFSGLDGDNEGPYRLVISGQWAPSAGDKSVLLNWNGAGVTGAHKHVRDGRFHNPGVGEGAIGDTSNYSIIGKNANNQGGVITLESIIQARTGKRRTAVSKMAFVQDGSPAYQIESTIGTVWENTATNLTSLVIDFDGGPFTGALILEKMGVN